MQRPVVWLLRSFMTYGHKMTRDAATTYRIMSAIKSKNTSPERILGKSMWSMGLRYRKHWKIVGRPDFVFPKAKIAVFCDGDFWHGNNWRIRGLKSLDEELSGYSPFWREKITRNMMKDELVNHELRNGGWLVFRFWESDIKKHPERCARHVQKSLRKRLRKHFMKLNTQ
jgi:DNA mismatch endonuclease, patch repair protein